MTTSSNRRLPVTAVCWIAALLIGCGSAGDEERNVARGRGLRPATLSEEAQVALYRAAIAASFEPGPGLTVLLHPRRLPRTAGLEGGAPVPQSLLTRLRAAGVVQGSCEPPGTRDTPQCAAPAAGYVVRGSDVFRAAGDTVQFHLAAERYATPTSGPQEALRFEKIYQLVPRGSDWRVAREARAPQ
jgi:hypothetical protein